MRLKLKILRSGSSKSRQVSMKDFKVRVQIERKFITITLREILKFVYVFVTLYRSIIMVGNLNRIFVFYFL